MVTLAVYAVLALVVVAALVALAVVLLPGDEALAAAPPDRAPWTLPAGRAMAETDVAGLRLPVTVRGYRFAETDAVLDRLAAELAERDRTIAALQYELAATGEVPAEGGAPVSTVLTPDGDDVAADDVAADDVAADDVAAEEVPAAEVLADEDGVAAARDHGATAAMRER